MISWSDVILILYSVTDMASYHTANIAHKFITSRHQYRKVGTLVMHGKHEEDEFSGL